MTATGPDERLAAYAALVRTYAGRLDLVSPVDLDRFESRHIDDSLRLVPLLDELPDGECVDVGSGAGLPGIPLALTRPKRYWRLLEPRRRRAAFLEECVRTLDLNAEVLPLTVEQAARSEELAGRHALAVARALASPADALALMLPLVAVRGVAAVFSGPGAEVPENAERWQEGVTIVRKAKKYDRNQAYP